MKAKRTNLTSTIFVALIFTAIIIVFLALGSTKAEAASSVSYTEMYTSIQIQKGDTLWTIAENNSCDAVSTEEYVNEVCQINGISENEIHSGQYLTIPYYVSQIAEN